MTTKSLTAKMPDYLRLGIGVLVFCFCFLLAVPELDTHPYFYEPMGMIVVALQVFPAAFWLRFRANVPISKTVLVTAIPAGIMGTTIGFQTITTANAGLQNVVSSVGNGASTMSLTVVYGGFLALIAYAFGGKDDFKISAVNLTTVLPCIGPIIYAIFFGLWLNFMAGYITFSDYLSPQVFMLFVGIFFLLLAGSALSNVARILAETSIIGIILSIVIALVVWFPGIAEGTIPKDATDFATLGLLYGTFLFMMSYYVSLVTGETDDINFDIKNWHLIESAALYILLVFAPPSIFELA